MEDGYYRLEELADEAGISPRTVRYYTSEGLLPPPDARGKFALYSATHLQRLKMIQRLKDAYFPLEAIRAQMNEVTDDQVTELLNPNVSSQDAASYIARVMAKQSPVRPPSRASPPPPDQSVTAYQLPGLDDAGEPWQRITLAPGVELHTRVVDKFVAQIVEFAKSLRRRP